MAYLLWLRFLRHNLANPHWSNGDRFVLSAGHGSMFVHRLLHLTGYDLPLEQIKQFRQCGSLTPGHPERGVTLGVEVTTGPLGEGFGNGVGLAFRSFYFNAECNVLILDEAAGRALALAFAEDLGQSLELRLEDWNRRPLTHRLGDALARHLSPLL